MKKYDLSILIPARNEMFLAKTIENIMENVEGNTEVIALLDGQWADPAIKQHPDVKVVYFPESLGQREGTNQACRLSNAKYVMKVDAHCSFDKGFDVKILQDMHDDWTLIPTMKNLHAFDWVCQKCGNKWYQGPTPTHCFKDYKAQERNKACDSKEFKREIRWIGKESPNSRFFRFDNTLHFQYWGAFEETPLASPELLSRLGEILKTDDKDLTPEEKKLKVFATEVGFSKEEIKTIEEAKGDIAPTKSIQGSCFVVTREKYWELNICDKAHGSWGQQGVEVACKTWLSGGKVMNTNKTWYAHLFRTQGGDFGFPYPNPGISKAREFSRNLWLNNKWHLAKHDLDWMLEIFGPVPDWGVSKGILFYTDNQLKLKIAHKVQNQLKKAMGKGGLRLVSVSLKPMDFGDNIHMPLDRGYITMTKQILAGLKELQNDVVFFTEHDVLYDPSHFDFIPPKKDVFYYNTNVWKVRYEDGHALRVNDCKQLSGMCCYRDLAIEYVEKRLELLEKFKNKEGVTEEQFNKLVREIGFEPGTHNRVKQLSGYTAEHWHSPVPNVDIRHDNNLTPSRWNKDQFRNQKFTEGWTEATDIPGWGEFKKFF